MKLTEQDLIRIVEQYRQEAEEGRRERIEYNKRNFDVYHMRQNYSHKIGGQSTEFIAKQQQAVDQLVAFILQGIYESNDWYSIEAAPGIPAERLFIQPNEAKAILDRQLKNTKINEVISDLIQLGLLGSLMVAKVRGHYVDKPNYTTNIVYNKETASSDTVLIKQSQKKWQLKVDTIRQEQFYPDPTGRWLFIVEELEMDYHELLTMAEEGMFKKSDVLKLKGKALKSVGDSDFEHSRETGQNYTTPSDQHRHKIRLYELWGKVVKEGELVHDNIHAIIADDICVLSGPNPNPNWHGGHPYIVSPILRVANSVWHRALMDAASSHNITMNELYNLIIDGAMMSVHGIKQLRDDYVKDSQELSGGIPPGTTLSVTRDLPHNAKVIENVVTSTIPPEAMQVFGMIQNEHNQSSLTNDLRLGSSPQSDLRATAIVEASQSIQGVIGSCTRRIEESLITPLLEKSLNTIMQNMNDMDAPELIAILGEQRAQEIMQLTPEERFAATSGAYAFRAFGISKKLNKISDFRKLTAMMQTVFGNPILAQSFMQRYSADRYLDEILSSLDVDVSRIKLTKDEEQLRAEQTALAQQQAEAEQGVEPGQDGDQSKIPQAGGDNMGEEGMSDRPQAIGFPPSPAVKGMTVR